MKNANMHYALILRLMHPCSILPQALCPSSRAGSSEVHISRLNTSLQPNQTCPVSKAPSNVAKKCNFLLPKLEYSHHPVHVPFPCYRALKVQLVTFIKRKKKLSYVHKLSLCPDSAT